MAQSTIGIVSIVLGALLGMLIHRASLPLPPPSDPTERELVAPYHKITSGEYFAEQWWHEDSSAHLDAAGKIALITGGSSGIGRAVAEELCRLQVASVVITSRSLTRAQGTAEEMVAHGICNADQVEPAALDLGSLKSVRSFAEKFL